MRDRRNIIAYAIIFSSCVVTLVTPFIGSTPINFDALWSESGIATRESEIFWLLRLPRVALGFAAGACLGISGMAFQAIFRNALATPYTLGISSGAALGATVCITFGLHYRVAWRAVFSLAPAWMGRP